MPRYVARSHSGRREREIYIYVPEQMGGGRPWMERACMMIPVNQHRNS